MSWVDLLGLAIIVGIAFLESHRGFGLALFDLIGAVVSVKIAIGVHASLAKAMTLGFSPGGAQGLWLVLIFLVVAVLAVIAGRAIYQTTLLSLDVLDPILGAILGIVSGCIVTHILLRMMVLTSKGTAFAAELADTFLVRQLIEFQGYHYFLEVMRHLGE